MGVRSLIAKKKKDNRNCKQGKKNMKAALTQLGCFSAYAWAHFIMTVNVKFLVEPQYKM